MRNTVVAAALLLVACRGSSPPPQPATPPNVLLVTIDTLRADRLNPDTMPRVTALASAGTRFVHARAVVPLTEPSHTTILTGALPAQTGVHVNGTVPRTPQTTIAGALHGAGYRTGAFVGAYVLDRRFGLSLGFDTYDDRVERDPSGAPRLEAERRGDHVVDAALAWLRQNDSRPFFAWIHLYDPHAPYEPPPEYLGRAHGRAYDGEVMFADAQVGRVLDWLKSAAQDGRTIVAIAGDHGEGLGDHGEDTHGMLAYDSTLRVPLVIRQPGRAAAVVDAPVSLVDLPATLCDLAGVAIPESMRHWSIMSGKPIAVRSARGGSQSTSEGAAEIYAETQYPRAAGWHALTALVDQRWKVIASSETELYDLENDPGETHNIAQDKTPLASALTSRAARLSASAPGTDSKVSDDARERLQSLGYVASSAAAAADNDRAPNPAGQIYAWNTFERVLSGLSAGDAARALPDLGKLARSHPDSPIFQSTYARALKETGRVRDALDIYRRAVARWPDDASLYHDLAVAATAAGKRAEAARAEQAALALDPSNGSAANGLGLVETANGHPHEAVRAFEKAVTADPTNAVYWTNLGNARRDAGNAAGAEEAYRTALEHDPRSADAANGMGVLLVQRGNAAEAITWFERALAGDDTFVDAHLNLGIAYQESGLRDKAAEQYRRVLALAQPGTRSYSAAATLLAALNR
ncbi:MAG TPA: sulfatase-like hydrolase/transferase [Vicinamibacterales bacterium]|nr:sulfatase-like hydrolase/transferase [Vicinamibacterales bacterium]